LAVGFSRDGRTLLTADALKTIRMWAVARELAPTSDIAHGGPVRSVALSPDGRMAATGSFDRHARLWGPGQNANPWKMPHGNYVADVLFSPDGRTLLTTDWGDSARFWDVTSGQPKPAGPLRHEKRIRA